jgi:SAM-dependent methyltransferase
MTEMATDRPDSGYALGNTDEEHERLIKQSVRFLPFTERLFRDAGVGPGQRVLELGSGMGDVAMLVARLIGPSGEVVGVERDARSIARAQRRLREAGIGNVTFVQCDASELPRERPFDAAVGRLILQYLPDPGAVMRSVSQLVRRGGAIAFQEPSFKPYFALCSEMPLWSACGSLAVAAFQGAGANAEMGPELPGVFERAGCLHRRCEWRCPSETIWKVLARLLICSKACCHKLNASVCPLQRLEILRRCRKD